MSGNVVFVKGGRIYLDSRMSGSVFAKAGLAGKIREPGLAAVLADGAWTFSPWTFDSTVSSADLKEFAQDEAETVFLEGECFNGAPLSSFLENWNSSGAGCMEAASAVCGALDAASPEHSELVICGTGGIVVSDDFTRVLFLPRKLLELSFSSLDGMDFSRLYGGCLNPAFSGKPAVRFLQAAVVYLALCGKIPFAEKDASRRESDIRDLNYCPLRYLVFGAEERILLFTENAFAGRECQFPKDEFSAFKRNEPSPAEMERLAMDCAEFLARRDKKLKAKRWLRAKSTVIKISIAVFAAAIGLLFYLRSEYMEKRTTKGLSSLETLEMYYSAINLLDVDSAHGSSAKSLGGRVDRIANIFVTGKTSSMYDAGNDLVPPSVWLVKNQPGHNIYGISNFTVDGAGRRTFFKGHRRNERPDSVAVEDGRSVFPGMKKEYSVSFFIFDSLGEDSLSVSAQNEKVSLEFKKDRWIVSEIQTEIESQFLKFSVFKEEYSAAMEECGGDVFACASVLRRKYDFIPSDQEIKDAQKYLEEQSLVFLKPAGK